MSRFAEIKNLVDSLESDFTKFYENGNKAAGTRVRNGMLEIKKIAQEVRTEVTNLKKESGK
jgi:hypothetical protein